ncbi:YncE family protein [Variovorax sp. LT1R20]|uniref:YncE family protein n=1 Tax=Variovorax sp. LT1R20 TaxID=3443729 RepID=UPI003F4500B4
MTLKFTAIVGFCLALAACGGSGDGGGAGGFSSLAGAGAAGTNGQQAKVGLTPEVPPEQSPDSTKAFSFKEANSAGATAPLQASDSETMGGLVASTASSGPPVDPASLAARAALKLKRQLLPSEWGIGFASAPGGAALTRTLRVTDSRGGALPWTATSNASWLSVTSGGTTGTGPGAGLVLTANPQLATMDAINYATVTLKTSDPDVTSAVVKVGLWRSGSALTAVTTLPTGYTNVVADKIRPYVYAHNGGTSIDIYNAHLGTKAGTIADVGTTLAEMTVAPDGSKLYVGDTSNDTVAVIDLATASKTGTWPLTGRYVHSALSLLAIRTNGQDIVLVGDGYAYVDGRNVATLPTSSSSGTWVFAASPDGRRLFAQNEGLSPATVMAFDVDYPATPGAVLRITSTATKWNANSSANGQDLAMNADGSALYVASANPPRCYSLNPVSLAWIADLPGGNSFPNNIEITSDGRVICGIDDWYTNADLWIHSPDGRLLKSFKLAGYAKNILSRQLVVTPDGMMAVGLTSDPLISFIPLGAP